MQQAQLPRKMTYTAKRIEMHLVAVWLVKGE